MEKEQACYLSSTRVKRTGNYRVITVAEESKELSYDQAAQTLEPLREQVVEHKQLQALSQLLPRLRAGECAWPSASVLCQPVDKHQGACR